MVKWCCQTWAYCCNVWDKHLVAQHTLTTSLSGELGREPERPFLVGVLASFFGNWSFFMSSRSPVTHSSRRLLTLNTSNFTQTRTHMLWSFYVMWFSLQSDLNRLNVKRKTRSKTNYTHSQYSEHSKAFSLRLPSHWEFQPTLQEKQRSKHWNKRNTVMNFYKTAVKYYRFNYHHA